MGPVQTVYPYTYMASSDGQHVHTIPIPTVDIDIPTRLHGSIASIGHSGALILNTVKSHVFGLLPKASALRAPEDFGALGVGVVLVLRGFLLPGSK
eukprot:scaffold127403_cov54-Attheya_sp.AAC.2